MPWDDELERLTLRVRDTLGDEALAGAEVRAMVAMRPQATPIECSPIADMVPSGAVGTFTPMSAYYDALKTELRRLLVEH